ncbi:MAG: putative zinc-binding protein [Armatimonadota bacterium]
MKDKNCCSGGSNVGQIANEVAKLLDTAGEGGSCAPCSIKADAADTSNTATKPGVR